MKFDDGVIGDQQKAKNNNEKKTIIKMSEQQWGWWVFGEQSGFQCLDDQVILGNTINTIYKMEWK